MYAAQVHRDLSTNGICEMKLTKQEKEERTRLLLVLTDPGTPIGELENLLGDYCHEGLDVDQCGQSAHSPHCEQYNCEQGFVAGICSASATGKTRERAIRNLASKIQMKVHNGYLGC